MVPVVFWIACGVLFLLHVGQELMIFLAGYWIARTVLLLVVTACGEPLERGED